MKQMATSASSAVSPLQTFAAAFFPGGVTTLSSVRIRLLCKAGYACQEYLYFSFSAAAWFLFSEDNGNAAGNQSPFLTNSGFPTVSRVLRLQVGFSNSPVRYFSAATAERSKRFRTASSPYFSQPIRYASKDRLDIIVAAELIHPPPAPSSASPLS